MQPNLNERDLILQAQNGDPAAISALYSAYVQAIYRYARYRVDSDTLAEDITSDVFLRMVRELPNFRYTGAPFSAWLYRIAANRIADHYRSRRFDDASSLSDNAHSGTPDLLDAVALGEEYRDLRRALRRLPEDYQNILILRVVNELSYAEIAQILNRSETAARVLHHRALKALGETLLAEQSVGGVNHG